MFGNVQEREPVIVLDIDETLFDSIKKHHQELTKLGQQKGEINLPTFQDVLRAGGTHSAYKKFTWYLEANGEMRNSTEFNSDLEPMEGAQEAVKSFERTLQGYLTTRPEKLAKLSRKELIKNGFPDREIIARPKGIPLDQTTQWKIGVLKEIAKEGNKAIMIDDSLSLHRAILSLSHPLITSLLFKGPITPDHPNAKTWSEIVELLNSLYSIR